MEETVQGKITRGVGGFYYVFVFEKEKLYECRAKGIFRNDKIRPLVGDTVEIQIISEKDATGNITRILPRKSCLVRPAVANVDQAMVIFSVTKPDISLNLLDRMLIHMKQQHLSVFICLNKSDLDQGHFGEQIASAYEAAGYPVLLISALRGQDVDRVLAFLKGKTTTAAGPSGVGKSTLINRLQQVTHMETGTVSRKLERGRHTTRYSQLLPVDRDSFILDTPGFGSLDLFDLEKEELASYYEEFAPYEAGCRFTGCSHTHEPVCGVKEALAQGKVSALRYETYRTLYEELEGRQKKY